MNGWRSAPRARKFVACPKAASAPIEVSITKLGKARWAFRLALLAGTCLAPLGAHAQFASDTWKTAPTDGQYNNAANWAGGNIPASSTPGTLYTATFGTSAITTIAVAAPSLPELYVNSFQFNAGASAYTFNVADGTNLRFQGAGIVNNSSNAPTFNLNGSSSNLWLGSAAKAGNAIINITNGGDLLLGDTASAENAVINVTGSNSAGIEMFGGTLGNATVTLSGDFSTGLVLRLDASGGSARVIGNGGSIVINQLTGAGTTLGSLAGANTSFNVNLGSKQLTVGGNDDSTSFAGRLNGTGGSIGKAGIGTWTLTNGTHTYDGLTTISGGTLALSGNGNLANSSGIALANSGTTFDISAANGNRTVKDLSGVAGSAVVLGIRTLSVGTANDTTFAGDISGTGGLTKQGSGTLTLSGSNAYTGATTITAGTLALSGVGDISASSGVNLTGATAQFDISASGGSTAIKDLAGVADSKVILGGNSLAVGSANSTTFAGVIDGSGGGLIKQGTGTLTLTAVSTYTGATQINGGTLALSGSGSIALSNSLTLDGTGAPTVFDISQTSGGATIGSLLDVPSGPPPVSTAVVRLGSKTLTITEVMLFAGTIADGGIGGGAGGGLTIAGVGGTPATAVLSGTNTYTGATTIGENATLELDDNGSISSSSIVNLTGAGAVFDISCGCLNPQTIKDLQGVSGTTVRLGDNSLTVGTANSTTFEGVIDAFGGTGGLIKQGSGTLTLGGANTYTGETMINAGTLKLTNADAVATSSRVTVALGATLDVSGTSGLGYARVQTLAGGGTVQLGDSGLEITNGSTEFSGAIIDDGNVGGLRISGGTLTLSGISTYTNLTEIQQGATLALKGAGSIAASSRIEFKEVTSGVATFDISQTDSGASVMALVENRSAIGVVALGSKELTLTGTATDFQGEIQDGGIGGGAGGKLTLASGVEATLRGFNTYTGATTINDGATLKLADFGSIHRSSVVDLVGIGARFNISGLGFGGVATIRNLAGNGTVELGSSALELSHASGEFAGKIIDDDLGSGLGGEFVVTNGSLTLTGQSTYTGMTAIGGGAALSLKGTGSIDKSAVIYFDPRGPSVATFDISQTTDGASVRGLLDFGGRGIIELGSKTLTVTELGNFVGTIQGAGGGLALAEGARLGLGGIRDVSGTNTYTGVTTIGKNATLALFDYGSIAASSGVRLIETGATLDISCSCGIERTVQNLEGVAGSHVVLGDNNLAVVSSADTTFAGIIAGGPSSESTTGSLIKRGNGTLTLSGISTYAGGTAINGGVISISSNANLGAAVGTLAFGGGTLRTTADVSMSRVTTLNAGGGTFDVAASTTLTQNGVIGGGGGLIKVGDGTLVLSGANTYTGGTIIDAGAVAIAQNNNLGGNNGSLTFDGGTLRFLANFNLAAERTVMLGTNGGTIDTNGFSTTISQAIVGDGGLTKAGAGALTLTATNTYTGATTVSGGRLALSGSGNIAASSGVAVASGATFDVSAGGGLGFTNTIKALTGAGTVQLGSLRSLRITNASGEFSGAIVDADGSGSLLITGGTLTLSGVSTYGNFTRISQGATLALKGEGSIASSRTISFEPLAAGGAATLDISQTTAGASVSRLVDPVGYGAVVLGERTLTITGVDGSFFGIISGSGGLTLADNARQYLSGVNTYTGATTVGANATLLLVYAVTIPGSPDVSISASSGVDLAEAGARLDISGAGGNQTIQDLSGVAGTSVALGGRALTVGTSNNTTFAGVIADGGLVAGSGGALIKQGSGTLTLTGTNTYTGATTINAGTLVLLGGGSIAGSSGIDLAGVGTKLDISGVSGNSTIQDLSGVASTFIVLGGNSLTVGTANSTTFAGVISGAGGLTKQGIGTLTLTGTNTYTGDTTVSGGTLAGTTTSLQGNIVNNAAVVFNQGSDGTYAGNMSGSGSLTKTGGGNLTLSGTNTYTGDTTVSAGTLTGTTTSLQGDITNNAAVVFNQTTSGTYAGVMSGTGSLTKTGTGTVILTNNNSYGGGTIISDGVLQLGNGGTTGMITGNVVVTGADSLLAFNRSDAITFAGDISGTGGIMLMGPGTVVLTGNNTFSGGTAIGGGIVQVASDAAFGAAGTTLKIGGGATVQALASFTSGRPVTLIGIGGIFDTNGNTLTLEGPITGGGALTKTGVGTLILTSTNSYSGGTTVEAGTVQGNTASLQGAITNNASVVFDQGTDGTYAGAMSGTGSLTKTGAGNLTLSGANSYVGGTTVSGGTLTGSTTSLQGNIAVTSNATVAFNQTANGAYNGVLSGGGALVKTGSGNLTLPGANTYSGGTTVAGGTLTGTTTSLQGNIVNNATVAFDQGINGTYAGNMSGSGGLVKNGAGTLILTGVNSYTGGTTVSGGILQGNTAALQGNVVNNATVVFNQATNGAYAGAMSGNGALVKTGTGNLTLTGANSYTGGTTVSDGTLTGNTTSLQGNIVNNATVVFDQGVSNGATLGYDTRLLSGSGSILGPNANRDTGGGTPAFIGTGTIVRTNTNANGDTGSGTLVNTGAGTLTIAGANTYAGAALTDIYGTAMSSGSTQAIAGAGTLTLAGTNTYSGSTTVSGGTLTLTGSSVFATGTNGLLGLLSSIYAGAMSGSGALVKTGDGNLTLTGANSYTGGTTVSGGILIGTTSSLQGGIVNNATVAFDQSANGAYDGAMSGSGVLLKIGVGNVTLTGANSYAGGTTVYQGTLTGTTSSLQGNIVNNATVVFNQATNGAYAGMLSGNGSLIKTGAGALTLTGTNSYSGGTTVNAGTLIGNSTSLQGNILNNAAVVFDQASNGVYAGVLSGSGTLTKTGAGLLNLTGNSVVGGGATVSGGTLAVNGSLTSNVTVGTGGAIGGTGTITGLLTLNGGTLAPGNSIGTLNVTGNFVQTGGVYQVEANAGGQSDKIIATGTATTGGGTTVQVLAAQGTYQRSTTYTILSATGGLTGTYGGVTSNLAFLTPSLSYDANNVFLTLELLQNAFSFGGLTPNQRAVGRTLDTAFSGATGDFATVLNAMTGLSTAQGPAVLDTISGQPYASFGTVNVLANLLFMNTVGQQMALARTGGPGAARVALAEACEVACEMQEPPRWGAWFSGLGGAGTVGGNYNAGGLTYNLGGAAVGVDYRFDPRFLVGLAFGYSSGRQWVSGFQGLGTTDNYSAVLYASFTQGGFYADALAGYAYSDNRQQRVMQIPGLATRYANGGAGANQFLGQIEAGYKIGFGLTETAQASVTPFARFQTVAASQKGFSEWGADSLNLNVQQQNTTSIRTVLGADLAANLPLGSERSLGVTLRLGWAHDYGDTARPMTAAFAGAPTVPFTIVGAQPMRDSAVVGFGLSTKITDSISAYARYDGELNGRDDNHNFSAGFRMTW